MRYIHVFTYTAQQKFSTDFIIVHNFVWKQNIQFDMINKYGDLLILYLFVSARQKVIWLGVSGLTLHVMSSAEKS